MPYGQMQDSEEEGTGGNTASHGSAGRSGGKRSVKQERKPAMPQYAVKRKELQEGWDQEGDDVGSDEDLIEGMDDMLGESSPQTCHDDIRQGKATCRCHHWPWQLGFCRWWCLM